ncbi:MAG: hypothetical protein LBD23_20430, partial [Oscillospiraceae bacterium]|nr:hypothetical protein [Oscillospiraceae bacterium]
MTKKSVEAKNQEVFENWGSMTYFKTVSPGKKWVFALMDEILSGIDTNSIKKVLDVGCGIGDRTYYMSTKLPKAKTV